MGVRVSPLWRSNPEGWYLQLEAHFGLASVIANTTGCKYALLRLTEESIALVANILGEICRAPHKE